jgi:excisionase family DNA binding protein
LSAGNAILAEGITELLEQYAESTAARVAELVNGHRPAKDEPRYYTTPEAADYLRCCVGRIYNLTSSGRLKGRKDGGRLLFTRADLDALLEASP